MKSWLDKLWLHARLPKSESGCIPDETEETCGSNVEAPLKQAELGSFASSTERKEELRVREWDEELLLTLLTLWCMKTSEEYYQKQEHQFLLHLFYIYLFNYSRKGDSYPESL